MIAVILAGGEGARLRPLTLSTPKPLLPILNVPAVEYILRMLARHGVDRAILSTGYRAQDFGRYLKAWRRLGVEVEHVSEDRPLGTAGAVRHSLDSTDSTFLVFNGDILADVDLTSLLNFHRDRGSFATLALTRVSDPTAYGTVPTGEDGRVRRFLEKPRPEEVETHWINAGTYALEPSVLEAIPQATSSSFERDIFPGLLAAGRAMFGFPLQGYWLDVGTAEAYLRAHHDLLSGRGPARLLDLAWEDGLVRGDNVSLEGQAFGPAVFGDDTSVEAGAEVAGLSSLGAGCRVASGSLVEASVLLDGCAVAEGAEVRHSVLGKGVFVGPGSQITGCIIGDRARVGGENQLRDLRIWPGVELGDSAVRYDPV